MATAEAGGYQAPGEEVHVTEAPEKTAGKVDDLFGEEVGGAARPPPAASLSGYHHTG